MNLLQYLKSNNIERCTDHDGRTIRILSYDFTPEYPIMGVFVNDPATIPLCRLYNEDGVCYRYPSSYNLNPHPKETTYLWILEVSSQYASTAARTFYSWFLDKDYAIAVDTARMYQDGAMSVKLYKVPLDGNEYTIPRKKTT